MVITGRSIKTSETSIAIQHVFFSGIEPEKNPIMLTLVQHMDCRLVYRNKVASMRRIRLEQPVTLRK
ncbi:MAG: hypothetical protein DMG11_30185 [Acidobacteria bacterium]|nr:MAG: hypothetical protein DMG11_30185 [Acidobacteriota bacterium]